MDDLENTVEPDDELDPFLREHYHQINQREADGEPLADWDNNLDTFEAKFLDLSVFDDDNDEWEHDIGELYRQYRHQKDEPDFIIDDDDDFSKLEAKYGKKN